MYVYIIAFIITPSPQLVGVGQIAEFRCQNPSADLIAWRMNKTQNLMSVFNPPRAPGITIDTTSDAISILNITAQSNYNETEIVCRAAFTDGRMPKETIPVRLLIQGETDKYGTTHGSIIQPPHAVRS